MRVDFGKLLYGGDYNPDQWLEYPDILKEDIRLMKKAHINVVSLGIFAWSKLEPEEGVYDFDWMEEIIDRLYQNGISVILATPSGARPHWLADKYPEVLRVTEDRRRNIFGLRHNHCYTSPVYREKVRQLNSKLAERFDHHPGVILWHISNEYGEECHCPLCQQAFRDWVQKKYKTIDEVNRKWNTSFWSHDYQSFDQIESPSSLGESSIHGLYLDWRRFVSSQTIDFCRNEIRALRDAGGTKPVTTNMMYNYPIINYHEMAKELDIISWDTYPTWHKGPDRLIAMDNGMQHDIMRTLKKAPYMLMESCPGATNWQSVSKLKRPGMLEAASLQAIAHGSESVLYFQIRKGRGGFEKFHGAVIDHYGKDDERTYLECCEVGSDLERLSELQGSVVKSDVAVVYDWENRWALENAAGPRNKNLYYKETVEKNYYAFRKQGLNVDVIDMTQSLDEYRIVAAPMLYMFRAGFAEKVRRFVENGGTFILTYWSGVVDENDLTVLGGTPGELMDVMGLRSTEIDALYDGETNRLIPAEACSRLDVFADAGLQGAYACEHLCQLVNVSTARPLFVYGEDFYKGTPALTVNDFGRGRAYYVCADAEQKFYDDIYAAITREAGIERPFETAVLDGVEVTARSGADGEYIFIQNFNSRPVAFDAESVKGEIIFAHSADITGPGEYTFTDKFENVLAPYATIVLKR